MDISSIFKKSGTEIWMGKHKHTPGSMRKSRVWPPVGLNECTGKPNAAEPFIRPKIRGNPTVADPTLQVQVRIRLFHLFYLLS